MSDQENKTKREPDVVLKDGAFANREIYFDFTNTTRGEYRELFDLNSTEETENDIVSKSCDLEPSDFEKMSIWDFRRLMKAYHFRAANPLEDPKN